MISVAPVSRASAVAQRSASCPEAEKSVGNKILLAFMIHSPLAWSPRWITHLLSPAKAQGRVGKNTSRRVPLRGAAAYRHKTIRGRELVQAGHARSCGQFAVRRAMHWKSARHLAADDHLYADARQGLK